MHGATTLSQSLAVVFALLTALSNALALTTQHIASTRKLDHFSVWHFVRFLFRQPLWLFGWLALVGSLVFQALALHFGPMSEVQPLLVSELIMALLLRQLWLHQRIRTLAWLSSLVTIVGLSVFLFASAPSGRVVAPASARWTFSIVIGLAITLALVSFTRRGSSSRRAALFASATGVTWALEATFIKAATDSISSSGFVGALAHWPIYAFIVGGVIGLLCEQAALHVGPLKVSQPFIVIVDPIVSVALGLWLYSERLNGGTRLGIASVGFLFMCAGVVVLTQSSPSTMKAEIHRL
jgi:drug/metabolite transporter (DMT)-like permease